MEFHETGPMDDKPVVYIVSILDKNGNSKTETYLNVVEVGLNKEWTYVVWFDGFTMKKEDGKIIGKAKAVMPHDSDESLIGWAIPENWTYG